MEKRTASFLFAGNVRWGIKIRKLPQIIMSKKKENDLQERTMSALGQQLVLTYRRFQKKDALYTCAQNVRIKICAECE